MAGAGCSPRVTRRAGRERCFSENCAPGANQPSRLGSVFYGEGGHCGNAHRGPEAGLPHQPRWVLRGGLSPPLAAASPVGNTQKQVTGHYGARQLLQRLPQGDPAPLPTQPRSCFPRNQGLGGSEKLHSGRFHGLMAWLRACFSQPLLIRQCSWELGTSPQRQGRGWRHH